MIVATRQRNLRNSKLNLFISDTKIEQVSQHKVLGITVDSELKWLPHIENIHKKIARNVYLLSQLKFYVDVDSLKMFFLRPHPPTY